MKIEPLQPRILRYRNHNLPFVLISSILSVLIFGFWAQRLSLNSINELLKNHLFELTITILCYFFTFLYYWFFIRPNSKKSVQVYTDYLLLQSKGVKNLQLFFDQVERITVVFGSVFYLKMKDGKKYYFSSSYERVEYVWEGLYNSRKDLLSKKHYEEYRIKLVQFDHHQQRREWFLRHKIYDFLNWSILPVLFLFFSYLFQSRNVLIYHEGLYFFRLFMFCMLVLIFSSFLFSLILKKLVFDRKIQNLAENENFKIRNLEEEEIFIQRSKLLQSITTVLLLVMLIKMDLNFYSLTKVRSDVVNLNFKKGNTIVIDNRYNCINCRYSLRDGDFVIFGKGVIGQVIAKEGEMVGEVSQDRQGRVIASENIHEVPPQHLAVMADNGKDIMFVKISDLVGKVQN